MRPATRPQARDRGAALLGRLLSRDLPRSRTLTAMLVAVLAALLLAPLVGPDGAALGLAAPVLLVILLVASCDLLLGGAGLWSFAQPLHFAIGLQAVNLAAGRFGPGWGGVALGAAAGLLAALVLSLTLTALTEPLYRQGHPRPAAVLNLALAVAVQTLAEPWLAPTAAAAPPPRLLCYGLLFAAVLLLGLALLRILNSPFGHVLGALRDNAFRTEALGYRTALYRTLAQGLAALFACAAGVLAALWWPQALPPLGRNGVLVDSLLLAGAVIIGGRGTVYGAVLSGAGLVLAASAVQALLAWAATAGAGVPWLAPLLAPAAWPAWLALPMVLMVYRFPAGAVGLLRTGRRTRA